MIILSGVHIGQGGTKGLQLHNTPKDHQKYLENI